MVLCECVFACSVYVCVGQDCFLFSGIGLVVDCLV